MEGKMSVSTSSGLNGPLWSSDRHGQASQPTAVDKNSRKGTSSTSQEPPKTTDEIDVDDLISQASKDVAAPKPELTKQLDKIFELVIASQVVTSKCDTLSKLVAINYTHYPEHVLKACSLLQKALEVENCDGVCKVIKNLIPLFSEENIDGKDKEYIGPLLECLLRSLQIYFDRWKRGDTALIQKNTKAKLTEVVSNLDKLIVCKNSLLSKLGLKREDLPNVDRVFKENIRTAQEIIKNIADGVALSDDLMNKLNGLSKGLTAIWNKDLSAIPGAIQYMMELLLNRKEQWFTDYLKIREFQSEATQGNLDKLSSILIELKKFDKFNWKYLSKLIDLLAIILKDTKENEVKLSILFGISRNSIEYPGLVWWLKQEKREELKQKIIRTLLPYIEYKDRAGDTDAAKRSTPKRG